MKVCKDCNENKEDTEYYRENLNSCKDCYKQKQKEYYDSLPKIRNKKKDGWQKLSPIVQNKILKYYSSHTLKDTATKFKIDYNNLHNWKNTYQFHTIKFD